MSWGLYYQSPLANGARTSAIMKEIGKGIIDTDRYGLCSSLLFPYIPTEADGFFPWRTAEPTTTFMGCDSRDW